MLSETCSDPTPGKSTSTSTACELSQTSYASTGSTVFFTAMYECRGPSPQLSSTPVADIEWQVPLLWAVGISIVGAIVLAIVLSIGTAIVTRQEPEGGDIRDKQIDRHGTRVGLAIMAGGSVLALVLAMLEVHVFWIGNAVFLIAALGTVIGQIVSLRAYHGVFRG